ncbi:MAG: ParA family protein [Archangium sp.]|nr:ParA family protein [Archangium sp.]
MTRVFAFINEKGGTGKTTLAVNVAAFWALRRKKRVLLVDLDTQGHAGKSLGVDVRASAPNVFHLLTDDQLTLADVTKGTPVPQLWLVPGWKELAEFPMRVAAAPDRELLLRDRVVEPARSRYDVVVLDAPPSLGLVSTNILAAATDVVVPVATTYLALDGCAEIAETVRDVATRLNPELRITRVVPTLYRKTALADEVVAALETNFPKRVSPALGFNVAIDEAQSHGQTIWEYAPWSRGATMLQQLAEALERA